MFYSCILTYTFSPYFYLCTPSQSKLRICWLALRTAPDEHLHHFGRISDGDILILAAELEKEKEPVRKGKSAPSANVTSTSVSFGERDTNSPAKETEAGAAGAGVANASVRTECGHAADNSKAAVRTDALAAGVSDVKMEDPKPAPEAQMMAASVS